MPNEPVEEIREYIADMRVSDAKQVISVLLKICDAIDDLDSRIDHVAEIVDNAEIKR